MPRRKQTVCGDVTYRNVKSAVVDAHTCNEPPGHEGRHTDGIIRWNRKRASK